MSLFSLLIGHYLAAQNISQAEFYFDYDPGFGNGTSIDIASPGNELALNFDVPTTNLTTGLHTLFVRCLDVNGTWSLSSVRNISIYRSAQVPVVAAEYFIGDDPGVGNGTPMEITNVGDSASINTAIDVSAIPLGDYKLYVRGLSENGAWSLYDVIPFTICETFPAISDFEYIQYNNVLAFTNNSLYATSYLWDFDDGTYSTEEQPAHFYDQPGVYTIVLIATNSCGIDTSYQEFIIESIDKIEPEEGGQGALVSGFIQGNGFTEASIVKLCKSDAPEILIEIDTSYFISIHSIIVEMNLYTAALGLYDVKIINGSDTLLLPEGFEVVERIEPTFDIYISGPSLVRTGFPASFNITIINHGNVDALLVPIGLGNLPWSEDEDDLTVNPTTGKTIDARTVPLLSGPLNNLIEQGLDTNIVLNPHLIDSANGKSSVQFVVSRVPPGKSNIPMKLSGNQQTPFEKVCVTATISPPMVKNTSTVVVSDCYATALDCAMKIVMELTPAGDAIDCIAGIVGSISGISSANGGLTVEGALATGFTGGQVKSSASTISSTYSTSSTILGTIVDCGSALFGLFGPVRAYKAYKVYSAVKDFVDGVTGTYALTDCLIDAKNACSNQNENGGTRRTFKKYDLTESLDPNLKTGPGVAGDNYVNGFNTMSYTIQFENVDSATAAAQTVIIIDSLDVSKYDLSTFTFLDYGFGSTFIPVNVDEFKFMDILDLRPEMSNLLRVDAELDTLTGVITWVFTTLDTLSFSLTQDPVAGFLPPNVDGVEGQGFVSFGIELNESVESGDIIENNSVIIFDNNEPIVTNTWDNGFDDVKPNSQVNTLPAVINDTTFTITWGGNDDASGVRWYDIYVSINDEEFSLILSHTEEISWILDGEYGDNYKFYSIATDKAGNIEDAPNGYDAETTLEMPNSIWETEAPKTWLAQNFPNPTGGFTSIEYSIAGSQKITLVLEDMLGRPVRILDKGIRDGHTTVNANLSDLSSGVYYLTLYTENERFTKKLILNR